MNTPYKYETILADNTIAEDRDGMSFIWDNYFYEEERINEYSLHLFLQGDDGRYDKFTETHYQKAYEIEQIKEAIENGGLEFVGVYDAFTKDPPRENSERLYFIAREKGKVETNSRWKITLLEEPLQIIRCGFLQHIQEK